MFSALQSSTLHSTQDLQDDFSYIFNTLVMMDIISISIKIIWRWENVYSRLTDWSESDCYTLLAEIYLHPFKVSHVW